MVHIPNPNNFEMTLDGEKISLFKLENDKGNQVYLTNYGARIISVIVPDNQGNKTDVVLGFGSIEEYINDKTYQGAAVGRFANRIAFGKFEINGHEYNVSQNLGDHCLHGGFKGFHTKVWNVSHYDQNEIIMDLECPDGEDGFPGNLKVTCKYRFTSENELIFECSATTDMDTVVNFTQHNYFNLKGEGSGTILDHKMKLYCSFYDEQIEGNICVTDPVRVTGTPFDFMSEELIGTNIDASHPQIKLGAGFDHNYHLDDYDGSLKLVADVVADNGIFLQIFSNQPCCQLYTFNWADGTQTGKSGNVYQKHGAFCLEPQLAPNAPNRPDFNNSVLRKGERYTSVIIQKFSTTKVG